MAREQKEERILIPRYVKGRIFRDCGEICTHCGKKLEFFGDFTLEHVIPISKGGTNDTRNFVSLCRTCNKEKSNDIIPPIEFFPYLPEKKRHDLQDMFDEYVTSQDWLDWDNLFMTDWFDISANRVIALPKTNTPCFIPMPLKVRRLREDDAMWRLQVYRARLSRPDATLIVNAEDELREPYYEVTWNGKPFMMFTAYITTNLDDDMEKTGWKYALNFDYYIDWELKISKQTGVPTVYNAIMSILKKAQSTLLSGKNGNAVLVQLRTPKTSHMAVDVSRFAGYIMGGAAEVFDVEVGGVERIPGNRVRTVQFVMFAHDRLELKSVFAERRAKNFRDIANRVDKATAQQEIDERLSQSKRFHERYAWEHDDENPDDE